MSDQVRYIQQTLQLTTSGRGMCEITGQIQSVVQPCGIVTGLCHVFIRHASASLIICENADPDVRVDLESFMQKLVHDGDPMFVHTCEGTDDMPAHVRSVLTQSELTLPICQRQLALGTWQGVYLWEHRQRGHSRQVTLTLHGTID